MNIINHKLARNPLKLLGAAILVTGVSACDIDLDGDGDHSPDKPQQKMFEVTLTNLTQSQPFSPPALVLHSQNEMLWHLGEPASVELEMLAEGGNAQPLADLAVINKSHVKDTPVGPAGSVSWTFELEYHSDNTLSLATMLVNTNDAFTGLTGVNIAAFEIGETHEKWVPAYDSGTEYNDESAIPGPAAVIASGFDASRNADVNRVYMHSGVLTMHELSSSVLSPEHKFDNPVAKIIIKRVQ